MSLMNLSPFHGIFSSFSQGQSEDGSMGAPSALDYQVPTPATQQVPIQQPPQQQSSQSKTGQIAVDIYEQEGYYIIRAPIAGAKLSDLDIEVDGKVITIRGHRKSPDDLSDDQYYLRECFYGEFSRSVTLPCVIDAKKVKATFSKDSILKILIPKEEKVKIVRVSDGG